MRSTWNHKRESRRDENYLAMWRNLATTATTATTTKKSFKNITISFVLLGDYYSSFNYYRTVNYEGTKFVGVAFKLRKTKKNP